MVSRKKGYKICVASHKSLSTRGMRARGAAWCNLMDSVQCLRPSGEFKDNKECRRKVRAAKRFFGHSGNIIDRRD